MSGIATRERVAELLRAGSYDQAIDLLRQMAADDHRPPAQARLVAALVEAGRLDEAREQAFDLIQSAPLSWSAHNAMARTAVARGEDDVAVEAFLASAALRRQRSATAAEPITVPAHYLIHNLEQIDHLEDAGCRGVVPMARTDRHAMRDGLLGLAPDDYGAPPFVKVSGADADALLALPLMQARDPAIAHPLNPNLDRAAIARAFQADETGFAVIDDLLSPAALEGLRSFCLRSTVWNRPYRYGYVGAFPEDGFASPLLLAIARNLIAALPAVLGGHRLSQWWAFVYDARLPGTDIHGDDSDVSLNLWVTESAANLDPDRGGLIMWDRSAPVNWGFDDYNSGGAKVRQRLAETGARSTVVLHAANRAILFRGKQFHESDGTRFRPGFANRRRNITLLFRRAPNGSG